MSTVVRYYRGTMSGAPALSNTADSLIAVFNACLVNGFGNITLDSLVVSSNVATATYASGHGFTREGSGLGTVGCPVIQISGATPSELNGDWRIDVTSSTTFTFATTGISDQTATGTIVAKIAPAGFELAFSDTNKAVYRSLNTETGTRFYLRLMDSNTTYTRVRGYEAMTTVDSGTGDFPTVAQFASDGPYIYKCTVANLTRWHLISNGRLIYFLCDPVDNGSRFEGGLVFGDFESFASADNYKSMIICATSSSGALTLPNLAATGAAWIARLHDGSGSAITSSRFSHLRCTSTMGQSGENYPASTDNALSLFPVEIWNALTSSRGIMPGLWCPVHSAGSISDLTIFNDIPQLPDRVFLTIRTVSGAMIFDITGPW